MQTIEQIETDPIKAIYKDSGIEEAGVQFDNFKRNLTTNPKARKAIYEDLGFAEGGVTYERFEEKLGLRNKLNPSKALYTSSNDFTQESLKPKPQPKRQASVNFQTDFSLPKLEAGLPKHQGGLTDSFNKHISEPVTEQTLRDVNEAETDRHRAEGFIENATNFTMNSGMHLYKAAIDGISQLTRVGRDLLSSKTAENKLYNEDGSLTEYATKTPDDLASIIIGLDGVSKDIGQGLQERPLANHMVGRGFQSISEILPDVVAAGLLPEVQIGQGLNIAAKYGLKAITNPFTRVLTARKALEGYTQADDQGLDKIGGAVSGAVHGAREGAEMYMMGELGGAFGKAGLKTIEKTGFKPGAITKAGVDLLANYTIWGAYGAGKAIAEGSDDPFKAGNDSGFLGVLFAAKGLYEHSSHNVSKNESLIKDFVDADHAIKTQTLFRATPESISEAVKLPGTAEEFHGKGLQYAEEAMKESDPEKKEQLITASSSFKKIADIKQGVESISMDKKSWLESTEQSGLDPEVASAMKAKIEAIHKDFNPDEAVKTEISKRLVESSQRVKTLKEDITEDPIQSIKNELDLEDSNKEIKAETEKLKSLLRNERSEVAEILPGEKFFTIDGKEYVSSGRDLLTGKIFNITGKAIEFGDVDLAKTKANHAIPQIDQSKLESSERVRDQEKLSQVINEPADTKTEADLKTLPEVAAEIEAEAIETDERQVGLSQKLHELKQEVKPIGTSSNELAGGQTKSETGLSFEKKVLSLKEIDRITRGGGAPGNEITIDKKHSYQAVLKKKFSDLSKGPKEEMQGRIAEFVNTVHEYRNKNRIKSEKQYTEKGTKEQFNGLNYWIDSATTLLSQVSGMSKTQSSLEINRLRSDWAKNKVGIKSDSTTETDLPQKTTSFKEAIESLAPEIKPLKSKIEESSKDFIAEDVPDHISSNEHSQVGFTNTGEPVFVLKENKAQYEKYSDAIAKKLQRIESSDFPEGSNETIERTLIETLKARLKGLEVAPISFKTQTSKSAKNASLLDKAEQSLNNLKASGKKGLRDGRAKMNSGLSPESLVGAAKVVTAEAGLHTIKSIKGLEKLLVKLSGEGKLSSELSSISDVEKKNLLKLVKSEQERQNSGLTPGEIMGKRAEEHEAAVKAVERQSSWFSEKTLLDMRQKLWDFDGNLVRALNRDGTLKVDPANPVSESYGQRAERLLKVLPAAYSKADAMYTEAIARVYGSGLLGEGKVRDLSSGEQKLISDIALYQRVIELDTYRLANGLELMEHPGGLDIVQAKQKLKELEAHEQSIVDVYGDYDYADLKSRVKSYYEVLQGLVDYRYANGIISKAAYDKLKQAKYYSPRVFLNHLIDDGFYSNRPTIKKTIDNIKDGSEGEIVSNISKIMRDAIYVVHEVVARNASTKAIADLIESSNQEITWGRSAEYSNEFIAKLRTRQEESSEASPSISGANEVRVDEVSKYKFIEPQFRPAPEGYTLKIYRDGGVKRGFYLKNEFSKELDGLRLDPNEILRHLSLAPTVRTLATATNWAFAASNSFRDAGFAIFTSPHYSTFFPRAAAQYTSDFVSSLKDSFTHTGEYLKYMEQGGGGEYNNSDSKLYSGEESSLRRDLNIFWDLIAHRIPSTGEIAGRLAVRKRALKNLEAKLKKEGTEITPELRQNLEEQASYQALKLLNFSEGGSLVKEINSFVPFTNVGVIASRNLVRYARSNPKEFASKVAQLAAYVAGLSAWNNGLIGDDKIKEMGDFYTHNISERDKASNFIVMTPIRFKNTDGNTQYLHLRIPKSQDQMLFAGLAEYGAMSMAGVESYTKEKYLKHRAFKDVQGIISYLPDGGNLLPPVIKGGIGYVADYDFFRGEHFTKSEEMARRKNEDQYDLNTPERWKWIGEETGLSPVKLQGAFKSTIPTSNQFIELSDVLYTKAFGEDTKAIEIRNRVQGTPLDRLEKLMDQANVTEEDKQDIYKTIVTDIVPKIPGMNRLVKLTSPTVINEDRDDMAAEDASTTFHETEGMKELAYRFKKDDINKQELMEGARNVSEDPTIIKRAIGQAKAAIKLKRGTPEAFDIVFSGISSPKGQARLLHEKVTALGPDRGLDLIKEIRSTGLFTGLFWIEYKKLEKNR